MHRCSQWNAILRCTGAAYGGAIEFLPEEATMVVFSAFYHAVEALVVSRARTLGRQVEADLAVRGADAAHRLAKMEDLSFLRVTLFA